MQDQLEYSEQDIASLSFEETYAQLTESVKQLEDGSLTLNEATQLYLSGIKLANHASALLNKAELQIRTISQSELTNMDDELND
jgi:exodeoxyribonuclease VII small subunit